MIQRVDDPEGTFYQCDRCGNTWAVPIDGHRCGKTPRGSGSRHSPRVRRMIEAAEARRAEEIMRPIDPQELQAAIDDLF